MQRLSHRVAGTYRVTFSPEVWRLIGSMPAESFQQLQVALERLADAPHRGIPEVQSRRRASLKGLTIVYELDEAERFLTVVSVVRAGAEEAR
jgi:plasmid stabilization system protein ParE